MKCKNIERLLNKYLDNELPEQDQHSVRGHLSGCAGCSKIFTEMTQLKSAIASSGQYNPNPFLWTRIYEELKHGAPVPAAILVPKLLKVWIPIAASLLVLTGFILYKLPQPETQTNRGTLSTIFNMPITQENMEKVTLNLLVYSNGLRKHPL